MSSTLPYIAITELESTREEPTREEQMEQLRSELSTMTDTYENIKSVVFESPFAFKRVDSLSGEDYVPIEAETVATWWQPLQGPTHPSEFQTDMLNANASKYEEIDVQQKQDKYGRTIYMFDDKLTQHLIVVIFKMRGRYMVSVNEVLMTLEEFLSITAARTVEPATRNPSDRYDKGAVECTIAQRVCTIPRTTIPLILLALSTLEKDYGHMFESLGSCGSTANGGNSAVKS